MSEKSTTSKNKTGFFFGAGAECSYGFPTGAEFAFKVLNPEDKVVKEAKKNFSDFLKLSQSDVQKIAESMIKNQKDEIIKKIKAKDDEANLFESFKKNNEKLPKFSVLKKAIDKFDEVFADTDSEKDKDDKKNKKIEIEGFIKFNVALSLFLCGDEIKDKLNENIKNSFNKGSWINKDSDFFQLNKNFIMDFSSAIFKNQDEKTEYEKEFEELKDLTNKILNSCIDYQLLFENFDSAFYPSRNKTQYRKIVSLLFVMREVIKQVSPKTANSYYEDVKNHFSLYKDEDFVVCTTNYSKRTDGVFGDDVFKDKKVYHLNGDVDSFFDLENKCIRNESEKHENCIPFIFPQVALKPIMYFDVIQLYSDAFCELKDCSKIAIVGFGLNKDDNLLNGMFEVLLEENPELKIFYFDYDDGNLTKKNYKEVLKLKGEKEKRFQVLTLDSKRNSNGKNWLKTFLEK